MVIQVSNLVFKDFNAQSTSTVISGLNTFCHADAVDLPNSEREVAHRFLCQVWVRKCAGSDGCKTEQWQTLHSGCWAASIWSCRRYTRCFNSVIDLWTVGHLHPTSDGSFETDVIHRFLCPQYPTPRPISSDPLVHSFIRTGTLRYAITQVNIQHLLI